MKLYCEECNGLGYHEEADYDYDENILETKIRIECDSCAGQGYRCTDENTTRATTEKITSFLLAKDTNEDICKKIKCNNTEKDMYECVDCIIKFFGKDCVWVQDEVCVNDESEHCADFVDGIRCGRCRHYE